MSSPRKKSFKRTFNDEMAKRLRKLKLRQGPGKIWVSSSDEINKEICIMEAVSIITGQAEDLGCTTDTPACVSQVIIDQMIDLNDDNISDRQRAKLKSVVPDIIGTAPICNDAERLYRNGFFTTVPTVVKNEDHKGYQAAERKREKLLRAAGVGVSDDGPWSISGLAWPFAKKLDLIRQLAAVDWKR